ncbi:MAG: HDOD domain-containing protein [Verrucomicrobiota bacterium]
MSEQVSPLEKLAETVPSLPDVVTVLDRELKKPDCSPSSVECVINTDGALSARLLKIANSSFYGFASRIETISQALTMIGLAQLRDLVVSASVMRIFQGINIKGFSMESYWRHSVATGICARQIATQRGETNLEPYFVTGLLHDIGRLVVFKNLPAKSDQAIKLAETKRISVIEAENEIFRFNHADLACRIMKNWKLPPRIYDVVENHHKPTQTSGFYTETIILHVADLITNLMKIGDSGEVIINAAIPKDAVIFKDLDFELTQLIEEVEHLSREACDNFLI